MDEEKLCLEFRERLQLILGEHRNNACFVYDAYRQLEKIMEKYGYEVHPMYALSVESPGKVDPIAKVLEAEIKRHPAYKAYQREEMFWQIKSILRWLLGGIIPSIVAYIILSYTNISSGILTAVVVFIIFMIYSTWRAASLGSE